MARPSERTREVEEKILERMLTGDSLTKICAGDDFPALSTVFKWLAADRARRTSGLVEPGTLLFLDEYDVALDLRLDLQREQLLDISDDGSNDTYRDDDGRTVVDHDHIQRSKLRVETRKWLMSVMAPKRYGKAADAQVNVSSETHMHNHVSASDQKHYQDRMRKAMER